MRSLNSRAFSTIRDLLERETAGGVILMGAAALGFLLANSPASGLYDAALHFYIGPLNTLHWINDGLMAVFFLLVGLEIKREMLDGYLSKWRRRVLPGLCAAGGMIAPAIIFVAVNRQHPQNLTGWAVPAATDIAFALGVLALLGPRVPASLKVFLTALAIADDLGAILLIGLFYSGALNWSALGVSAAIIAALAVMNRRGMMSLWPYLLLGLALWCAILLSGLHATVAGVALAMFIPLRRSPGAPDNLTASPLHRLEHGIQAPVGLAILPIFGLANAGVSVAGMSLTGMLNPLTLGVGFGLILGKLVGVFGTAFLTIRLGFAEMPSGATNTKLLGVSVLCGIGFTMSLFIANLAFESSAPALASAKIGVLVGSVGSALIGWAILSGRRRVATSALRRLPE